MFQISIYKYLGNNPSIKEKLLLSTDKETKYLGNNPHQGKLVIVNREISKMQFRKVTR